jgi:hypothetical protein
MDCVNELHANLEELPLSVIDNDYLTLFIPPCRVEYYIDLRRIDTPGKLNGWLMHLSEKSWFNREHLAQMLYALESEGFLKITYA